MASRTVASMSGALVGLRVSCGAAKKPSLSDAAASMSGLNSGFRPRLQCRHRSSETPLTTATPRILLPNSYRGLTTDVAAAQPAPLSIATTLLSRRPPPPSASATVPVTIHRFPSLEPASLELWSAHHLRLPLRRDLLHLAVVHEASKTRQGTAHVKNRWELHGSHRKMRPQKGTGHARLGTRQAPTMHKGGKSFGPHPRDFANRINRKVYDRAWRTALSLRYRRGELLVVEDGMVMARVDQFTAWRASQPNVIVDGYLARRATELLVALGFAKARTLFVATHKDPIFWEAMDKTTKGRVLDVADVDVKDLLEPARVVIEKSALKAILHDHQSDLVSQVVFADGSRRMAPMTGQPLVG